MTGVAIKSRLLRQIAERDDWDDLLAEFCALLIDALSIADVRDAVAHALRDTPPLPPPPVTRASSPPARSQPHRRGHR